MAEAATEKKQLVQLGRDGYEGPLIVIATGEHVEPVRSYVPRTAIFDPDTEKEVIRGKVEGSLHARGINAYEIGDGYTIESGKKLRRIYAIVGYRVPEEVFQRAIEEPSRADKELRPGMF